MQLMQLTQCSLPGAEASASTSAASLTRFWRMHRRRSPVSASRLGSRLRSRFAVTSRLCVGREPGAAGCHNTSRCGSLLGGDGTADVHLEAAGQLHIGQGGQVAVCEVQFRAGGKLIIGGRRHPGLDPRVWLHAFVATPGDVDNNARGSRRIVVLRRISAAADRVLNSRCGGSDQSA